MPQMKHSNKQTHAEAHGNSQTAHVLLNSTRRTVPRSSFRLFIISLIFVSTVLLLWLWSWYDFHFSEQQQLVYRGHPLSSIICPSSILCSCSSSTYGYRNLGLESCRCLPCNQLIPENDHCFLTSKTPPVSAHSWYVEEQSLLEGRGVGTLLYLLFSFSSHVKN